MPRTIGTKAQRALAAVLRTHRMEAELTQRDLAKKLGESRSWVAAIETGQRRVDCVELTRIAAALGVDPLKLFDRWLSWI